MSEEKAAILQGNLKGCELSLNQPGCGIKEQADRLAGVRCSQKCVLWDLGGEISVKCQLKVSGFGQCISKGFPPV